MGQFDYGYILKVEVIDLFRKDVMEKKEGNIFYLIKWNDGMFVLQYRGDYGRSRFGGIWLDMLDVRRLKDIQIKILIRQLYRSWQVRRLVRIGYENMYINRNRRYLKVNDKMI